MKGKLYLYVVVLAILVDVCEFQWADAGVAEKNEAKSQSKDRRPDAPALTPEGSMRLTLVRDGYTLELVAAEPLVRDPVAIDWGPDGKLWVAEMADYPYGMDGKGQAGGRIRFLLDSDDDGQYDKSVLFLDGVNFPTSVMSWRGGVLITAAPHILFAEDTNGDGKADRQEILFEGFMEGNQQLRVNGLRWGLDNWVYCASGGHHSGFGDSNIVSCTESGKRIALGSRDFRFLPDSGVLDPQSGPAQFGRVRDDWGHWFGVQNSHPLWHYVLADHYLRRNSHVPMPDARRQVRVPTNPRVYPAKSAQKRYHSFDNAGRFTSACGPSIYRDELLFERSEKHQHAFTCEPFHNLVQHHLITHEGTSFDGRRADDGERDFLASADRWCRPVMSRTGPDGALWVVDMYRYVIEHPDWLPDEGRNELQPFYRYGEQQGRIYRIYPAVETPRRIPRLSGATTRGLAEMLASPNGPIRDLAQRILIQRSETDIVPLLEQMSGQHGDPLARLHALCTLDGLGHLSGAVIERALQDEHAGVRLNAIRLTEKLGQTDLRIVELASKLMQDPDAKVRLQLACALGSWKSSLAGRTLAQLAGRDDSDRYTVAAILSSAEPHLSAMTRAIPWRTRRIERSLASGLLWTAASQPAELAELIERLFLEVAEPLDEWTMAVLAQWLDRLDEQGSSLETLQGQDDELSRPVRQLGELLERMQDVASDDQRPAGQRLAAVELLGRWPARRAEDTEALGEMLSPENTPRQQATAARRLGKIGTSTAAEMLMSRWRNYSPQLRATVTEALMSGTTSMQSLIEQVENGTVAPADLAPVHRQRLLKHSDRKIAQAAEGLFKQIANSDRESVLDKFALALELDSDITQGQEIFRKHCATCHRNDEDGQPIGPDLRAITDRSKNGLLTSIIDPNRAVEPRYLSYTAVLKNGQLINGMIVSESTNTIVMQMVDGTQRSLLRSSIDQLQSTRTSFMPNGLEVNISPQEMAHVIEYVREGLTTNPH